MKDIVTGRHAATRREFAELALGIDTELFTGVPGESAMERAARLDAAHDIIADLAGTDPELAAYARKLLDRAESWRQVVPLLAGVPRRGKAGAAALLRGVAA